MSIKLEHVTHTYGLGSPFEKTALQCFLFLHALFQQSLQKGIT